MKDSNIVLIGSSEAFAERSAKRERKVKLLFPGWELVYETTYRANEPLMEWSDELEGAEMHLPSFKEKV